MLEANAPNQDIHMHVLFQRQGGSIDFFSKKELPTANSKKAGSEALQDALVKRRTQEGSTPPGPEILYAKSHAQRRLCVGRMVARAYEHDRADQSDEP